MSSHGNASNDPRQPSAAKPYVAPVVEPPDMPVDYAGIIAVIFGVAGVMFRYKLSSWLALIFCAQSLSNMRNIENDLKQVMMAVMACALKCLATRNVEARKRNRKQRERQKNRGSDVDLRSHPHRRVGIHRQARNDRRLPIDGTQKRGVDLSSACRSRATSVPERELHAPLSGTNPESQESSSSSHSSTTNSTITTPGLPDSQIIAINHRFNGRNYLQWSQTVLRYIRGNRMEKYINGAAPQPPSNDPNFDTWFAENNQVMTWLCNSMTDEISEGYLLAATAKEIWDEAKQIYSSLNNTAVLIHLKRQLRDLRQGNLTVTNYYNTLHKLWQQQDLFDSHPWITVKDAQLYKKIVEEERVYDFLLGLNDSFEEIRGRIMGPKPMPHLFEVVNHVQFEESRKFLNQGSSSSIERSDSSLIERSSLAAKRPQDERRNKWCNYCKKKGHIKEECWKLHGKPAINKASHITATKPETENKDSLSKEELQMFRKMLDRQNKSNSMPGINLVQSGFKFEEDDWNF